MKKELLEVVNDKDEVIGLENRDKIHAEGILHRETHVWFVTPNKEIIFQHRGKNKKTHPDLLDATVGGHVEVGMTYEQTALKETEEETGIKLKHDDLIVLSKIKLRAKDEITGRINNTFKQEFAYIYKGKIEDLKVEKGEGLGFEAWPIGTLFNLEKKDKIRFIPALYGPIFLNVFRQIESKI